MYITYKLGVTHASQNTNFENLVRLGIDYATLHNTPAPEYQKTHTYVADPGTYAYARAKQFNLNPAKQALIRLANNWEHLQREDMIEHYDTFYIPKHSGGLRRIDAPKPELKEALRQFKDILEYKMHVLAHNSAHAYTKNRSIVTAMQTHQNNNSKWFLKLDLKDFFPAHTLEYILKTMETLHPFETILEQTNTRESLIKLIKLGMLSGGLPQGTPTSPILTNLLMTPIDYKIQRELINHQEKAFVYTRYADDLLISCKYQWNWQETVQRIEHILHEQEAPFRLNTEKTRFGSSSGRNWNLGIMLNKNNRLTLGHKQNQRLRAMLHNFLRDLTNGISWNRMEVQVMLGQISYYKAIDPEYVNEVITRYSNKFNIDLISAAKRIINQP